MKNRLFLPILFFCLISLSCTRTNAGRENDTGRHAKNGARQNEVVVYAYDSFVAEWGAGPEIASLFEAETGYTLTLISCGDAAQVLSRAILEKSAPNADVLLGIDNFLYRAAVDADVLASYKPQNAATLIPESARFEKDTWLLTPFDMSSFVLMFDTESGLSAPQSLLDLTRPEYAKKIILMDPRTSSLGLGFAFWTASVFGDSLSEYWAALKPNLLTVASSWSTGYGLFTSGESPLALSYVTSEAYHVECDGTDRYKALMFSDGHPVQIEGMGVVKGAANTEGAQAFIDFMIGEKAQSLLPQTQWMYPVNAAATLPSSFAVLSKPAPIEADSELLQNLTDVTVPTIMNVLSVAAERE